MILFIVVLFTYVKIQSITYNNYCWYVNKLKAQYLLTLFHDYIIKHTVIRISNNFN